MASKKPAAKRTTAKPAAKRAGAKRAAAKPAAKPAKTATAKPAAKRAAAEPAAKPAAKTGTAKPAAKTAAAKPAAKTAAKPAAKTAAAKPATKTAAAKSATKTAAAKPVKTAARLTKTAAAKPAAKTAAAAPASTSVANPPAKNADAKPASTRADTMTPASKSVTASPTEPSTSKTTDAGTKRASKPATKSAASNALPYLLPNVADREVIEGLSTRLLAFATRRARLLSWWLGDAGALAKGNTVQDVVLDAMSRLYGGEHRWDQTRYPDPFVYLVLVVKTRLWNLAVSSENRLNERGFDDAALVEITTPETLLLEIEANDERRARASLAASALARELAHEEELASLHELMINQGVRKPQDLAQRLSKPVPYVNNLRKRLARAWERVATRVETERGNA